MPLQSARWNQTLNEIHDAHQLLNHRLKAEGEKQGCSVGVCSRLAKFGS